MSDAVTALMNRETHGSVQVRDAGLQGMISVRGDLSDARLAAAVKAVTGGKVPESLSMTTRDGTSALWMSPDELLLLVPYGEVADRMDRFAKGAKDLHHLAVDVSDARAVLAVEGPFLREVLAKLAPVDLHPDVLKPGTVVRTRLGQIAAGFWLEDETSARVICFRSVADYAFDLLAASAKAGPVGHFPRGT
ncbi:sarcosine oxidase subunit gamma [Salipiger sp. IMCC34102]|uniref:sarcosine oxidase subunit gamma n=1 Tax=Salipiger sp. IMCC34102 TaxID=2510647 RepID=UPI00101BC873|nr:sarcosine oxidase subunit gamma family protein [Salipiger sp. IMCC34102]RYH03332.1 sarcosine oxidase subunit gamma [Salipiger sp. IMCC34102]